MALTTNQSIAAQVYLAYLSRPTDTGTLQSFGAALSSSTPTLAQMKSLFESPEGQSVYGVNPTPNQTNTGYISSVVSKAFQLVGRTATSSDLQKWQDWALSAKLDVAQLPWEVMKVALATEKNLAQEQQVAWARLAVAYQFSEDLSASPTVVQSLVTSTSSQDAARKIITDITGFSAISTAYPASGTGTVAAYISSPGSASNATFTLTENTNTVAGTASNDTIDGSLATTVAGRLQTWNNADSLDGGSGTDTLTAQLTANVTAATFKNIEVLDIEDRAGVTVDLNTGDSALTTIKSSNSGANNLTVQNIQSAVANYSMTNSTGNLTATMVNTKLAGAADAATLSLSNVTGGTVTLQTTTAANGYETITVNSGGSVANTLTSLTDGNGTSLATVNITGSVGLTLSLADTTVTTVNASTMSGALTLQVAAGNGQNMTVTGGTGNDILNMNSTFTTADTIDGGSGTDRLVLSNTEATAATTARTNVTNVEWLRLIDTTDGTAITVGNVAVGATGLQLGAGVAHGGNVSATFAAGTANFDRQNSTDAANETTTLTISGVATTDVMNVTLGTAAAASTWNGTGAFTINGAETVNISTLGGAATIGGALTVTNTAATEAIVVTGAQNLTITGAVTADSLNASGMTGTATLTMTGGSAAQSIAITGTNNADTLVGGTAADIINGGSGADTIRNAVSGANSAANDTLSGGAGFDSYQLVGASASAANYTGSAYIADFTVGSTAATSDTLVLDITIGSYGASDIVEAASTSITATAAGSISVQTVAQNAAAAAGVSGADIIKITTGVAFTTALQNTYAAAIGTASVTGYTSGDDVFVMLYDTTNLRAVIGLVDTASGTATAVDSADTITLVGTINMTAADYANFNGNHIAFVDF